MWFGTLAGVYTYDYKTAVLQATMKQMWVPCMIFLKIKGECLGGTFTNGLFA